MKNIQDTEINCRIRRYNNNVPYPEGWIHSQRVYNNKTVLFSCMCGALTTKTKSGIQAAEMRCWDEVLRWGAEVLRWGAEVRCWGEVLRWSAEVRCWYEVCQEVNKRRMLGILPLLEDIERNRWYGHVKRMNEGRLPRKCLDWQKEAGGETGRGGGKGLVRR